MDDRRIQIADGGRGVIAENGPLRLVIQAFSGKEPELALAQEAAEYSFDCLLEVVRERSLLSAAHGMISGVPEGTIAWAMLAAVRLVGDSDLTPMAAVAGSIADAVADWLIARGPTKVIVDNGGDIAIRVAQRETVNVGLRPAVDSPQLSHTVQLRPGEGSWGVNTSGLGGRSFTRGIASAVTAFAATSNLADAAATGIANHCFVADPAIIQQAANSLDPATDLGALPVTVGVQGLSPEKGQIALARGLARAEELTRNKIIRGAFLVVGAQFAVTEGFAQKVGSLQKYS